MDGFREDLDLIMSGRQPKNRAPQSIKALTQSELEDALRKAGWDEKHIPLMSAIGMAESALTPDGRAKIDSYNPGIGAGGKPTAERSYGPWQINMLPSLNRPYDKNKLTTDPVYSAKAALDIFQKQGFRAWGAFTDGRYKKFFKGKSLSSPYDSSQVEQSPSENIFADFLSGLDKIVPANRQSSPTDPLKDFSQGLDEIIPVSNKKDKYGNEVSTMGGEIPVNPIPEAKTIPTPMANPNFTANSKLTPNEQSDIDLLTKGEVGQSRFDQDFSKSLSPEDFNKQVELGKQFKVFLDAKELKEATPEAISEFNEIQKDSQNRANLANQKTIQNPQNQNQALNSNAPQTKLQNPSQTETPQSDNFGEIKKTLPYTGEKTKFAFKRWAEKQTENLTLNAVKGALPEDVAEAQKKFPAETNVNDDEQVLDKTNLSIQPTFLRAVAAARDKRIWTDAKKQEAENLALQKNIPVSEAMFNVGLINYDSLEKIRAEEAEFNKKEDELKQKYFNENQVKDQIDATKLYADQLSSGQLSLTEARRLAQEKADQPIVDRINSIVSRYGSFQQYEVDKKRIEEEYKYRYLAKPLEFAANWGRYIAKLPAKTAQLGTILYNDLNPFDWSSTSIKASETPLYQQAERWNKYLDSTKNKDFQDDFVVNEISEGTAQLATQLLLSIPTGGASILLPIGEASLDAYKTADQAGGDRFQRSLATIIGGLASVPDALLKARYLKALSPNKLTAFIEKFGARLFGNLSKEYSEAEARELTRSTLSTFLLDGTKNGIINFGGEYSQERLEDVTNKLVAKYTYNPKITWNDIFIPTEQKERGYLAAGIIGAFGGNIETVVNKMELSELQRSDEVLAAALQNNLISQENVAVLARAIKARADEENVNLNPQGTVAELSKKATETLIERLSNKSRQNAANPTTEIPSQANVENENPTLSNTEQQNEKIEEPASEITQEIIRPVEKAEDLTGKVILDENGRRGNVTEDKGKTALVDFEDGTTSMPIKRKLQVVENAGNTETISETPTEAQDLNPEQFAEQENVSPQNEIPAAENKQQSNENPAEAETPTETPDAPKSSKGLTRNFRAGTNDATLTFDSETQRDLYDLAAKEKYQMRGGQNKTSDRTVGDIEAIKTRLIGQGFNEKDLSNISRRVYDDIRAQMKGVKHLEERKVSDNVLPNKAEQTTPAVKAKNILQPPKLSVEGDKIHVSAAGKIVRSFTNNAAGQRRANRLAKQIQVEQNFDVQKNHPQNPAYSLKKSDDLTDDLIKTVENDFTADDLEKARIFPDGRINQQAFRVIAEAHKEAFGQDEPPIFHGVYLNPRDFFKVGRALKNILSKVSPENAPAAQRLLRQFEATENPTFGDAVHIITSESAPNGLKEAWMEETAHAQDYRVGSGHSVSIRAFLPDAVAQKAMAAVAKTYKGASRAYLAREVAAKIWREDAVQELEISADEVEYLQRVQYDAWREAGVTAEEIENAIDEVTKSGEYYERLERESVERNQGNSEGADTEGIGKNEGKISPIREGEAGENPQYSKQSGRKPLEWSSDFPAIVPHTTGTKLTNHPDYAAAKAGDNEAAAKVVESVVNSQKAKDLAAKHPNAILVPVHAQESAGKNKLPVMFARYLQHLTGLSYDDSIIQTNKTSHTGANMLHRLFAVPEFEGEVLKGREYILVDDVAASGSTFKALKEYIETHGGKVVEATTLFNSYKPHLGYSGYLAIKPETVKRLETKFDKKGLNDIIVNYGIAANIRGLTNGQGKYFARFGSVDSIREALIKAGFERSSRFLQRAMEQGSGDLGNDDGPAYSIGKFLNEVDSDVKITGENQEKLSEAIAPLERDNALTTITNLRRAGLLTGVKTHLKNVSSNAIFQGTEEISKAFGYFADVFAATKTGQRTISFVDPVAVARSFKAVIKSDSITKESGIQIAKQILLNGDTRENLEKQQLRQANSGIKALDWYVNGVFRTLGAEDALFKVYAFRRSLEEQARVMALNARKEDPSVNAREYKDNLLNNPDAYMIAEANLYADFATFQNKNDFASWVNKKVNELKQAGNKGKLGAFIIETAIPFTNTPSNVVSRVIDYSPAGFYKAANHYKNLTSGTSKTKVESGTKTTDRQAKFDVRLEKLRARQDESLDRKIQNYSDALSSIQDRMKNFADKPALLKRLQEKEENIAQALQDAKQQKQTVAAQRQISNLDEKAQREVSDEISNKLFTRKEQQEFASNFGRASLGTSMMALGFLLAQKGLLAGVWGYDDKDRKKNQEFFNRREQGIENGSLLIPRVGRVVVSDSPLGKSLVLGATMYEQTQTKDSFEEKIEGVKDSLWTIAEDQPFIKSAGDYIGSNKTLSERAGGLLGSFVPTLISDAGEVLDEKPRTSTGFKNSVLRRIPGAREYADESTKTVSPEERGGILRRAVRAVDPFNTRSPQIYKYGSENSDDKKPNRSKPRQFRSQDARQSENIEDLRNPETRYSDKILNARRSENVADIRQGTPAGDLVEAAYSGTSEELRKAFLQIKKQNVTPAEHEVVRQQLGYAVQELDTLFTAPKIEPAELKDLRMKKIKLNIIRKSFD